MAPEFGYVVAGPDAMSEAGIACVGIVRRMATVARRRVAESLGTYVVDRVSIIAPVPRGYEIARVLIFYSANTERERVRGSLRDEALSLIIEWGLFGACWPIIFVGRRLASLLIASVVPSVAP